MDFDPINSDHAVQTIVFTLSFDRPISSLVASSISKNTGLLKELPAIQQLEGYTVQIDSGAQSAPVKISGMQLAHMRPDGSPSWALRLMGHELAVECTRYTRWEKVWEASHRYLQAGLDAIQAGSEMLKVRVLAQQVVDVFFPKAEPYKLGTLLKHSDLVARRVFEAGPTWHSHVGWFEQSKFNGAPAPRLSQLHLDALKLPDSASVSKQRLRVQINHNREFRLDAPISIDVCRRNLNPTMIEMHNDNKTVLTALLADEMAKRIGLVN
jgi:uncharacterized protein (TIGR04255 family)